VKTFLCPGRNRKPFTNLGDAAYKSDTGQTVFVGMPAAGSTPAGPGDSGPTSDYAMNAWVNAFFSDSASPPNELSAPVPPSRSPSPQISFRCRNKKKRLETISDGTSNTLLIGSKLVLVGQYQMPGGGYDEPISSANGGVNRVGENVKRDDPQLLTLNPINDWGSPFESCPMGMADGSVRMIRFGINIDCGNPIGTGIGIQRPDDGVVPPGND